MAKRARPWISGALALCLLASGYLVAKQEFGEVGFRVMPPQLRVKQPQETVPAEAELPQAVYSPSRYLSAVTERYFDTYLAPEEFLLEAQSSPREVPHSLHDGPMFLFARDPGPSGLFCQR